MVVIRYIVKGSGSFCLPDNAALIHKKETEKSESIASSVLIVTAVVYDCGTPVSSDIWNTVTKPNYPVKKNLPASIGLSMAKRKISIRYKVKIKHLGKYSKSYPEKELFCLWKLRHGICQKFYTAGFLGQKFYTINFT